ncbi:MAG: DUF2344 domain-containing protein [Sedimentisphaerales bacterium]|nr:DUF2344 domain-containing protein [Sedimentisphaerales bacterium]
MNSNNSNNQADINEIRYLIIKFQIEGTLRFLSHSQTLSVFQRAVIRSGINPHYSQGFNPRPKISLPLPRPVGVKSDDELLVMPISIFPESIYEFTGYSDDNQNQSYTSDCLKNLSAQLPEGFILKEVRVVRDKPHFQECYASYIFTISPEEINKNIEKRINSLLTNESLVIERSINKKNISKKIDVRGFLFSIMTEQNSIIVRCKISSAGSIRIQEIMELLELDAEKLVCPIKRTNVQWLV